MDNDSGEFVEEDKRAGERKIRVRGRKIGMRLSKRKRKLITEAR